MYETEVRQDVLTGIEIARQHIADSDGSDTSFVYRAVEVAVMQIADSTYRVTAAAGNEIVIVQTMKLQQSAGPESVTGELQFGIYGMDLFWPGKGGHDGHYNCSINGEYDCTEKMRQIATAVNGGVEPDDPDSLLAANGWTLIGIAVDFFDGSAIALHDTSNTFVTSESVLRIMNPDDPDRDVITNDIDGSYWVEHTETQLPDSFGPYASADTTAMLKVIGHYEK
jgi:hypothetical protein